MRKIKGILAIFMVVGIMVTSAEIANGKTRTRAQKKTRNRICDPNFCDPNCIQLHDQKQDQLRDQKQDGSCDEEGILKANDDGEPNQFQDHTRERKKTCDPNCDPNWIQLRDQKQDQLRDQKQDGSCEEEVLKSNSTDDKTQTIEYSLSQRIKRYLLR